MRWVSAVTVASALASVTGVGCSSSSGGATTKLPANDAGFTYGESGSDPDSSIGGNLDFGISPIDDAYSQEALYAADPPPMVCGDGVPVPVITGTPDCPSDKNLPNCPCDTEGMTAPCWTGKRANRDHGICHDGTTTCQRDGEIGLTWGACNGEQLPTGTTGKAACTCFSGGTWAIDNLSPCFESDSTGAVIGAESTLPNYSSTGVASPTCPDPGSTPTGSWSHTSLTVDCAGHFKLCYALKAGDPKNPKATDCTITQQCAESDYKTANVKQTWPDLPAWTSTDATCAAQFNNTGGYGEMSVVGTSVECDMVNLVFNRVPYCSSTCNTNPSAAGCAGCSSGGSGSF